MPITELQTPAFNIRNAFYNALTTDPYFAGYTYRKTPMLQLQPDLIPCLSVYQGSESHGPDGDANIGMIRFFETSIICISVAQANNDEAALEQSLDRAYAHIKGRLWTDAGISNVLHSINPEGARIELIVRGNRKFVWHNASVTNATPLGEIEYHASIAWRSEFWPDITDTLNEIDVTVSLNNADTSAVQPVTVKYLFNEARAALLRSHSHG